MSTAQIIMWADFVFDLRDPDFEWLFLSARMVEKAYKMDGYKDYWSVHERLVCAFQQQDWVSGYVSHYNTF